MTLRNAINNSDSCQIKNSESCQIRISENEKDIYQGNGDTVHNEYEEMLVEPKNGNVLFNLHY